MRSTAPRFPRNCRPGQRHGLKSRQHGIGEELLLVVMTGIGLLFVVVFAIALRIGKSAKGKLLGFLIATTLLSPIWGPGLKLVVEQTLSDRVRDKSSKICSTELTRFPASVAVDDLLDETGGLNSQDIVHLLTAVRLRFLEIKLTPNGTLTAYQNVDGANWKSARQEGYAHLELGDAGHPDCLYPTQYPEHFFTNSMPVKPLTCLRVTYLSVPSAKTTISVRQDDLTRWSLRDRVTNKPLLEVTDAFRQMGFTVPHPSWDRRSRNRCESGANGYGLLLDRLTASSEATATTDLRVMKTLSIKTIDAPTIAELSRLRADPKTTTLHSTIDPAL